MTLITSQFPGRRERHLLRRRDNPLFPRERRGISEASLQEAQRLDHEELVEFITEFRRLVHEALTLEPNEESGTILGLKERLDMAYEQASGQADDQTETKDAIIRLLGVIMASVRRGAGGDPVALQELAREDEARLAHFALLEFPLVADILAPDSPIGGEELVPTLLSAPAEEMAAALTLFDGQQLGELRGQAHALIDRLGEAAPESARIRLGELLAFTPAG